MRKRNKLFLMAAALVGMLLVPTAAFANAYAPTGDEFITCVGGGDTDVDCTAGPFDPGTEFSGEASYNPTFATFSGTVNDDGEAVFSFDASEVPEGAEITVSVTGIRNGETVVLADAIAEVVDGAVIANAGSEAGLLAIGALGALALGGAALFVSRRGRTKTAA